MRTDDVAELIGNTKLIRLQQMLERASAQVAVQPEFFNLAARGRPSR